MRSLVGCGDGAAQPRQQRPPRLGRRPRLQQLRRAARPRGDAAVVDIRARRGRHAVRHRRHLRRRAAARRRSSARSSVPAEGHRARHEVRHARWTTVGVQTRRGTRGYIMAAVEDSLRRLRTDWIDLYQLHKPDPRTPIEETLRALDDLVRAGQGPLHRLLEFRRLAGRRRRVDVRDYGLAAFVSRAERVQPAGARHRDASWCPAMQTLRRRLAPLLPARGRPADRQVPAWRAAAGRRAADRHQALGRALPHRAQLVDVVEALAAFAEQRGRTLLELAFGWLASRPTVASVIAGATTARADRRATSRPPANA